MTVVVVLLVFAGIPLALFLLICAAVYGTSSARGRRYRPGRRFEFTPVWFLSAPERIIGPATVGSDGAVHGDSGRELVAADRKALAGSAAGGSAHGVKGGASGSW